MLATFVIEIGLVVWTLRRYRLNRLAQLAVLIFTFLAIFQLAEYMVCGGLGMDAMQWSRLGYVAITMLPPLGIHAVYQLADAKRRPFMLVAYPAMVVFVSYFLLSPTVFDGHLCLGNYVIFQMSPFAGELYALYYYGLVIAGMAISVRFAKVASSKKIQTALYAFAFGYGAFLLPTTTVNVLNPGTTRGIPSIMCGFAVAFALIVAFAVMPRAGMLRKSR